MDLSVNRSSGVGTSPRPFTSNTQYAVQAAQLAAQAGLVVSLGATYTPLVYNASGIFDAIAGAGTDTGPDGISLDASVVATLPRNAAASGAYSANGGFAGFSAEWPEVLRKAPAKARLLAAYFFAQSTISTISTTA